MSDVVHVMSEDHKVCDDYFEQAEAAAGSGDMVGCAARFEVFRGALLRHFRQEEEVLFPGFEEATGNTMGPTRMMRQEHEMMRELIERMRLAAEAASAEEYLGAADTLMVLMQQHNMKEEGILYPMCDSVLADQWGELHMKMQDIPPE
ncbi:MAG: hemerythrin domain-containing protein [Betaproteobacteria bacterium]|nr:hemerythrin domain-containing protein [Betaproteobacteria bacterium]